LSDFQKELQEKMLGKLHAALNPGGFLVLGNTETVPLQMRDSFNTVSLKQRIYSRN
jgi:chemotaxis methyl-accepting protein methylase